MIKPNSKNEYDVIIIGSGFAGIVAAEKLADSGLSILLVDENIHIGGQLLRKIPEELGEYASYKPEKVKKIGFGFVNQLKNNKIEVMNKTTLVGIYDNREILLEQDRTRTLSLKYGVLLFATGARERFLPFKGWTLPGVYSTGMLQVLIKSSGVLPAKKMLIAGSGLFLFAAGYEYLKNGGELLGIMELSSMSDKVKFLPQVTHQFAKFSEGGKFLAKIITSGVPVRFRKKVIEARGDKELEEVVVAKVDRKGGIISGTEKTYSIPALAMGYGFVPNIEAPQLAGCELEYSQDRGGWIVKVNDRLETTKENIFAAGEITGVGGAFKSITEGEIAAAAILNKFELSHNTAYAEKLKKLLRARKHHMSFVKCFNGLYEIKPKTIQDIPEETIICRCENVTKKTIIDAIQSGCQDPNGLKMSVRCAMGQCQGRTCAPVIYDILADVCDTNRQDIGLYSVRPPFKPVSVKALRDSTD
jgi:NADPH-dependent 2,4-dienoyl-CoA reductase/sulfur reductase-like enzyme